MSLHSPYLVWLFVVVIGYTHDFRDTRDFYTYTYFPGIEMTSSYFVVFIRLNHKEHLEGNFVLIFYV